jgi:hypothetical protein
MIHRCSDSYNYFKSDDSYEDIEDIEVEENRPNLFLFRIMKKI